MNKPYKVFLFIGRRRFPNGFQTSAVYHCILWLTRSQWLYYFIQLSLFTHSTLTLSPETGHFIYKSARWKKTSWTTYESIELFHSTEAQVEIPLENWANWILFECFSFRFCSLLFLSILFSCYFNSIFHIEIVFISIRSGHHAFQSPSSWWYVTQLTLGADETVLQERWTF